MSERPTPETACASFLVSQGDPNEWAVPLEVAENIERALGEAMEKYFAMRELSNNATELAEKYKRERDEARKAAIALIEKGCDRECAPLYYAQRLERERDEAREEAARWEAVALREASINGARIFGKEAAK